MQSSNIAWTDMSWNPSHGCSRVSDGCTNCYAERISRRHSHTEHEWASEHAAENVQVKHYKLDEPASVTKPSDEDWSDADLPSYASRSVPRNPL